MQYPDRALKALVYLFRHYNDIDVYVEDTTNRKMYEVLLQRILGVKARVGRIFQLQGCDKVIEKCKEKQNDSDRRYLCIIDGDFNAFFHYKDYSDLKNFYQLKAYCVENLLFSEESLIGVASECLTNVPQEEVQAKVSLTNFITSIVDKLTPLFIIYYVAHVLYLL